MKRWFEKRPSSNESNERTRDSRLNLRTKMARMISIVEITHSVSNGIYLSWNFSCTPIINIAWRQINATTLFDIIHRWRVRIQSGKKMLQTRILTICLSCWSLVIHQWEKHHFYFAMLTIHSPRHSFQPLALTLKSKLCSGTIKELNYKYGSVREKNISD